MFVLDWHSSGRLLILLFLKKELLDFFFCSDSAHRIHPMAGQGVNMGFSDVQCLLKNLERAVLDGADVGMYIMFSQVSLFFLRIIHRFVDVSCRLRTTTTTSIASQIVVDRFTQSSLFDGSFTSRSTAKSWSEFRQRIFPS